jgi:AcrR family transcriptional regulator
MARLTRVERTERIKAELVAVAGRVFLRHGFHRASLEEIAAEAGYTKGAVYSNFEGKDELFLAVLDDQYERQPHTQAALMREATTLEAGLRAAAQQLEERYRQNPDWIPLLVEFWTHASRRAHLRQEALKRHEHRLDELSTVLAELAAKHGVEFVVAPKEVARSASALGRGIALERLLDRENTSVELFGDMFVALVLGLTRR